MGHQRSIKGREKARREKEGDDAAATGDDGPVLICETRATKSGVHHVRFQVLDAAWLDASVRSIVWKSLNDKSRRMKSSSWAFAVREVLGAMHVYSLETKWAPSTRANPEEDVQRIREIRSRYYESCAQHGARLSTIDAKWGAFLSLLPFLKRRGLFSGVSATREEVSRIPGARPSHSEAAKSITTAITPRAMSHVTDSYHTDLLEPIPISSSNERFLDEYGSKLETALESIKAAAIEDLSSFVRKSVEGPRLVATVNYAAIHASGIGPSEKFMDPATGKHFFRSDSGHPNLLANVLALCRYEMGTYPRSVDKCEYKKYLGRASGHWKYVVQYGRNALLPYLAIPTIHEALACVVILLIEHPRYNVMSLINGELKDEDGNDQLLIEAGLQHSDHASKRMTVDKWRALSQKTGILSRNACFAIQTYLDITAPLRELLINRGDDAMANFLWIGISMGSHNPIRLHHHEFYRAFRGERRANSIQTQNKAGITGRTLLTFFERHPSLERWSHTSLKALRVNSGVLSFIKSDGNLAVAVEVFGHRKPRTTIRNYIPEALLNQIYERQVRRHQNSLIVWAHTDEEVRLQMTDFGTVEQLHVFLRSSIPLGTDSKFGEEGTGKVVAAAAEAINSSQTNAPEVIMIEDATAIAVSLLYRDHLLAAPRWFLERPDPVTKLPPQFWVDLVNSLTSDLPPAFYQVRQLVDQAKMLVPHLSATTRFSDFWI